MFESDDELDAVDLNNEVLTGINATKDLSLNINNTTILPKDKLVRTNNVVKTVSQSTTRPLSNLFRRTVVKRKFPGPAGLLPDKPLIRIKSTEQRVEELVCSQSSSDIFEKDQWTQMWKDYENVTIEGCSLAKKYTINWIRERFKLKKDLGLKVPFLASTVVALGNCSESARYVLLTLKDMTGEIEAAMPFDLYEKYANHLKYHTVIVLMNFGVINMIHDKNYFLIITPGSLLSMYSYDESEGNVKIDNLNEEEMNRGLNIAVNETMSNNKINEFKKRKRPEDVRIDVKKPCLNYGANIEDLFNTDFFDIDFDALCNNT